MYDDRYAGRNPFYAPPRALVDVALEPGETVDRQIVHRISPEDPWRRVRNRWRAEGVFAGPPPQPPTYLIGSSGVTLYRGDCVSSGVPAGCLHRHRRQQPGPSPPGVTADGVGFRARRLPDESTEEFLASTDLWFRPVAFANGPDGALYIADLYREILDFSDGIPESIKRFKDLNRGNDRGRIYRVVPDGFKQPAVAEAWTRKHVGARRDSPASQCVASGDGSSADLSAAGQGSDSSAGSARGTIDVSAGTPSRLVCARRSRRAGRVLRSPRARRSGSRR